MGAEWPACRSGVSPRGCPCRHDVVLEALGRLRLRILALDQHFGQGVLGNASVKVIDVAFEVGYSDPAHFARAFRRWTGLPPSAYRWREMARPVEGRREMISQAGH